MGTTLKHELEKALRLVGDLYRSCHQLEVEKVKRQATNAALLSALKDLVTEIVLRTDDDGELFVGDHIHELLRKAQAAIDAAEKP